MNNKKIIVALAAVGALTGSGYGFYHLGLHQGMKEVGRLVTGASTSTSVTSDRKVLYWHDPMVPAQKFDKPGKSPFMDMQLVPVYADIADAAGEDSVRISPGVQQNLGIRFAEVANGKLTADISAVGTVAYNERDVAMVQARSNGFVEKLYVRAPLDVVRKGQALAELYVPDWVAAQEEYLTARRMEAAGMQGLQEAARQRMRLVGMSDEQIGKVVASGKLYPRITLTAPFSGVVSELAIRDGMTVMAGAPLLRINGIATIWVIADIPENLSAQVRQGNAVQASIPALPGTVFHGKVSAILPQIDQTTHTLKVRIELNNPEGRLVPGMFANLHFGSQTQNDILQVPSEAVITTGTRSVVMLARNEGRFVPVEVETGNEANGLTEIRKGLQAGQRVVVSGQFLIDSEASLKATGNRMGDTQKTVTDKVSGVTHQGTGKIEKIDKNQITLSHDPIPSLQLGAMTTGFQLPASGLPRNVEVGDMVIFDIRPFKEGVYQIVTISPVVGVRK
ncbi:efflux RND transporter periplasmic adaptor subunit [Undibacterium sp. TJN19]|uniref:efflux RND transporter periplasmic adaptor subunit n=1 Tax=Undibacterium sp. TJN19 TaxID=3413055 RepID=UPI003BF3A0C3